jgi:hypothetical protein
MGLWNILWQLRLHNHIALADITYILTLHLREQL